MFKQIATFFSLVVVASVVLNGIHLKDVYTVHANTVRADDTAAKLSVADMHPHVDKQLHKLTHDIPQLDGRSLRLRDYKRLQLNAWRNLLDSWRDQLALYLG